MKIFKKNKDDSEKNNVSSFDSSKMCLLDLLLMPTTESWKLIGCASEVFLQINLSVGLFSHFNQKIHIILETQIMMIMSTLGTTMKEFFCNRYKYHTTCFLRRKSLCSRGYGGCYEDNCYRYKGQNAYN